MVCPGRRETTASNRLLFYALNVSLPLFRKKHWGLKDPTTRRQRERLKNQTNKQNWCRRNFHLHFARTSHFFVHFVCRLICGYDVKWPSFTMYIIWRTSHKQAMRRQDFFYRVLNSYFSYSNRRDKDWKNVNSLF